MAPVIWIKMALRAVPSGLLRACADTFKGRPTPAIIPPRAIPAHLSTSRRATILSVFHSIIASVVQQEFRRVQQGPHDVRSALASIGLHDALPDLHFLGG